MCDESIMHMCIDISLFKGLEVAKSINAVRYLECSAKHNRGVRECFDQAARVSLSGKIVLLLDDSRLIVGVQIVKLRTSGDQDRKSCLIL